MICQMGVPELAAKHALFKTGNNSAEVAISWYFENMDNPGNHSHILITLFRHTDAPQG